jgi:hypothetical protein
MMNADVVAGRKRRILKVGKKYLSCAPLKVKKRKEALILYARAVIETSLIRSGFKTPSKVQWPRCRPPVNAHIPMYAALSRPVPP